MFTECGSSCPRTCDNVNDTIICDTACRQRCECPSGMVIDVEQRSCVEPSQCTGRNKPLIMQRTSEDAQYGCTPRFVCPYNTNEVEDFSYDNPCQYTLEVTRVFKGSVRVMLLWQ